MGFIEQYYTPEFWSIYRQEKRFKHFYLRRLPFEDIAQEILIALTINPSDALSIASSNINRLIKDYGYNVSLKCKDGFEPELLYDDSDRESYWQMVEKKHNEIIELYKNHSAKWVLNHYGLPQTSYKLVSIARLIGGKKQYKKKHKIPYDQKIAEAIFKTKKISRHAFRQWKYNGYIPAKYAKEIDIQS